MVQPLDEGRSSVQENQPDGANKTQVKKPYVSPALFEYGSVAKLTEAGGLSAADGPTGFMMHA
jgi:hypothetical protein